MQIVLSFSSLLWVSNCLAGLIEMDCVGVVLCVCFGFDVVPFKSTVTTDKGNQGLIPPRLVITGELHVSTCVILVVSIFILYVCIYDLHICMIILAHKTL